jgi:hypothetical protein
MSTALVSVEVAATALSQLSLDDISVTEGNTGTTTVAFVVTQSATSATATTVRYATADGSATAPADYVAVSGTARIEAGSTSTEIVLTINGDVLAEGDESLVMRLSNAVNATIADGEGVADIADDDGGAPTTFELINTALADGSIDDETALVYKVFSEFADPRLPAQFRGRDDPFFEAIAVREAARRFETLTPATQVILAPFLEFPDLFALPAAPQQARAQARTPSPATTPSTTYAHLDLVPGMVRMAWDANSPLALEEQANALKAEFQDRIWPKLIAFLGSPQPGHQIQILLYDTPGQSEETVNLGCTIAKIRLYQFDPWVFTHELTHALLDLNFSISACRQPEKLWMHEATATWAQHYVYPPANQGREQDAARWFLSATEKSLSQYDRSPRGHEYGAYLWFFSLAGQQNNPAIVRAIWESAAGVTSLEAIESVLQSSGFGGFRSQWPKFALDNWNREAPNAPYHHYYEWDRLNHKASQHDFEVRLNGAGWESLSLGYDLPLLSADYQRWDFTQDPNVRGVLFENTDPGDDPNKSIQAIVKIKNQPWRAAEDWSNSKEKFFCRDNADEDIEEIILVIAHRGFHQSDSRIKDDGKLSLYFSALPCSDWTGSTTNRQEQQLALGGVSIRTAEGTGLRFRLDMTQNRGVWQAIEGTVTVRVNETSPFEDGTCTATGSGTFDVRDHAQFALLPVPGNTLEFTGSDRFFFYTPPITITNECSSSSGSFTFTQTETYLGGWFNTGPRTWPFDVGATTITGGYLSDSGDAGWTWDLAKEQ